jgi:hypothetical protein
LKIQRKKKKLLIKNEEETEEEPVAEFKAAFELTEEVKPQRKSKNHANFFEDLLEAIIANLIVKVDEIEALPQETVLL